MGINRMKKQRDIFSIQKEKNPAVLIYCDIIYTKAYRFEISGEEQVSEGACHGKLLIQINGLQGSTQCCFLNLYQCF